MTAPAVVLPVNGAGRFAGTIRHGVADTRPIHAAACARCHAAVYDTPRFDDAAVWVRDHLRNVHRIRVVTVDVRRVGDARWRRQATPVVMLLATAWGDQSYRPLVATWRADRMKKQAA